jgi:tetratricopeptide (TPR) repeat protein
VIHAVLFLALAWQTASPQVAEHMQAGIAAEKEKNFDVSIKEFKQVTELDPSLVDGFLSLGQAYMDEGDYGSAIPPLKHALELSPDSLPAHQLLGFRKAMQAKRYLICSACPIKPR